MVVALPGMVGGLALRGGVRLGTGGGGSVVLTPTRAENGL